MSLWYWFSDASLYGSSMGEFISATITIMKSIDAILTLPIAPGHFPRRTAPA